MTGSARLIRHGAEERECRRDRSRGCRVLELARVLAGPWIGQTLADLGADVIKVEAPAGDETRGWGPPFAADGAAAYFHACNRGKRSIALDFATRPTSRGARRLAAAADVVVENFKVGGLARFGLDYAERRGREPRGRLCLGDRLRPGRAAGGAAGLRLHHPGDGRDHGPDRRAGRAAGEARGRPRRPVHRALRHGRGAGGAPAAGPDRAGAVDRPRALRHAARGAGEPGDELPDRRR